MKKKPLTTYSLETITDKYIGKNGSPKRDVFEEDLKLDIIGSVIKKVRQEKDLTQEELGEIVGVKKAQISKIENNLHNVRVDTILKVFRALNTRLSFRIEILGNK